MTTSNLPSGVTSYGIPVIGSANSIPVTNGNYFFVCNRTGANGSDGNEGTDAQNPLATLAFAYSKCVASNGDVIIMLPGHAETISSNTTLAFSTAGVTMIGLGVGSSRPTFTFDTANTNRIAVTAANNKIQGCIFIGNFLSIATLFLVGAAPGFTVDSCEFRDTSLIKGFLSIITTTVSVNADGLTYTNNIRQSNATTTPGPDIVILGTIDRVTVKNNTSWHQTISNNVAALMSHAALVVTNLDCAYNNIYSVNTDTATGGILITTSATTGSGMIYNNYVRALDSAAAILVTATAVQYGFFNNYYIGDGTSNSGYLLPAVGTD